MLEQFLSQFVHLLEFLPFLEHQSQGLDEHVSCVVQMELADSSQLFHLGLVLEFRLSQSEIGPQVVEFDGKIELVIHFDHVLNLHLGALLPIVFGHEAHGRILVDQEGVLGILFPVGGRDQILVVDDRLQILLHGSVPHVELVLDLDYVEDLGEDVLEHRNVTVEPHSLVFGRDFADEVDNEHDQLVRHQLFLIFGAEMDVFQADCDDVDERVRILDEHFHLHLVDGLGAVNDKVSEELGQFVVVADWQQALLLLVIAHLHDNLSLALQ